MKITIVQGAFLPVPPLMGGAVEKVWFGLGKEFAQQGHQVTHISRSYSNLPEDEIIAGVRHLRIPGFDTPKSLAVLKFLDLVYSLRVMKVLPDADVLVTNTFWLPVLVRQKKHGAIYVHVQRYPKGQMKLYRHAARLQTVSSVIASAIVAQEPESASRVCIIPNPLPDEISNFELTKLPDEREKWLLYVGRIHPEKGINLLINGFKHMVSSGRNDLRLLLVGPWETKFGGGGQSYYEYLQKESQEINSYVDWVGSVFSPSKLNSYYCKASLFIYPSLADRGEASPLAPIEAMAHGCPTLVSDLNCFKDYIEDDVTGFIFNHKSPNPTMALAEKLQELLNSPERLMQVSLNGYKKAQSYSPSSIANLYLSDFESLLNHD